MVDHEMTANVIPEELGNASGAASVAPHCALAVRSSRAAEERPQFVVRPARRFEAIALRDVWVTRQVFWAFLWRNVFRRHRQTLLGPFWFVIGPLVRMVLLSVALGNIAGLPSEGIPYPIFTFTALLPWELFSTGVLRSSESLVTYEHIISKVYFPRIIVPLTEVFGGLMDFGIAFLILLGMIIAYRFSVTARLLVVPGLLAIALVMSLGLGLLFSGLHARYRDTSRLLQYVIQFLFYVTPVAYSQTVVAKRLPHSFMTIYRLNPMYQVVEGMRWAVLGTPGTPDVLHLSVATLLVLLLFATGAIVFANTEHSIVDMI